MTKKAESIADVPTSTLKLLIESIESTHIKAPISRDKLVARGFQAQVDVSLPPISGHPKKRDNAQGVFDVTRKEDAPSEAQVHG